MENLCRDWYETDWHIFVHAGVLPDLAMEDQPPYVLHWRTVQA